MSMNKLIHESRVEVMKFTVCEFSAVEDAKPTVLETETQQMQWCVFLLPETASYSHREGKWTKVYDN